MTPIRLSLHNFLSYKDTEPLDFSNISYAVLSGQNGVGKSSILEAITWAIWEKTRAASSDDLINQGETEMWVELVFEHEKEIFRIFRKRDLRKKGTSTLEFQIRPKGKSALFDDDSWESISEGTLRQTQDKIVNTLKLPYEIFVNSSYLRQGHADEFTIKTPSERKEILGEILGLSDWDTLAEKSKENLRELSAKTEVLNYQLEDLKNEILNKKTIEKDLSEINTQKNITQKDLKALELNLDKLNEIKKKSDMLFQKKENLLSQFQEIANDTNNLKSEISDNSNNIKLLEKTLSNKVKIEKNYQDLKTLQKQSLILSKKQNQYHEIKMSLAKFAQIKENIDLNIERIKKISVCPTCLRPLVKKDEKDIIKHLEKEYIKNLPKIKELENKLNKLGYNPATIDLINSKMSQLENIGEEYKNLQVAKSNIEGFQKQNQKLQGKIKINFEKLKIISTEGKKISSEVKSNQEKLTDYEKVETFVRQKRNDLLVLESQFGALTQSLKNIINKESECAEKEKELLQISKDQSIYEELALAFSKKGIQAMIIEQSIPAIEEEANLLLGKITDDRMKVKLITQKAKKTNTDEFSETLDIQISDELGERPYEMYSGGEAFRINFAIRIAISKLLSMRAGSHLKFLVIDEGFGTLDSAGQEDIIAAINSIKDDFEKIIIITHIAELKDMFPTRIEVTKDQYGSKIELVSS